MKTKIFTFSIILSLVLASCGNNPKTKSNDAQEPETTINDSTATMEKALAFDPAQLPEEPLFVIETTEGKIKIKLYKETPLHRDNFVKLASENFFDNILFHRVIKGFMIQGGDPLTKDTLNVDRYGTGGPGYTIPAEFIAAHKHKKGALAAARKGDVANPQKESSGSQFYIVENPQSCAQLDGQYTVFGETIEGLDVIDKIAATPTDGRDRPVTPVKIISVLPVQ